jgi:two-component system alkaline phosphatase synthesis response regulator PhoP
MAASEAGSPPHAGLAPKKILVIDDNPMIVELITHTIHQYFPAYHVIVAYDGEDGLARFYQESPDCVIIDVKMPRLDGFQLVRCLRGDASSADVPLIILSAMIRESDQLQGYYSGVDEYITKPFKPSALSAALDRVLRLTPQERLERLDALHQDLGGA